MKKLTKHRKMKLQKHVDLLMSKGVKDKGKSKKPAMTNSCGIIIKKGRN